MGIQKGEVEKAAQDLNSHSSSDEDAQPHEGGQLEDAKLQNVTGSSASVPSTSTTSNGESVPPAGHLDRTPGPLKDNSLRTGGVSESAAIRPFEPTGAGSQRGGTLDDRKRETETPGDDAPPPKIKKMESSGGSSHIGSNNIPFRPTESGNGQRVVDQRIPRPVQLDVNNPANPIPESPVPPAPLLGNGQRVVNQRIPRPVQLDGNNLANPIPEIPVPRPAQFREGIEDWPLVWNQEENQPRFLVFEEILPRARMAQQELVRIFGIDIYAYDEEAEFYNVLEGGDDDDEEPYDAD